MPTTLTPQEFVNKWRKSTLKECPGAQKHFIDLYNQRPTWLDLADRKLDAAVCDAYGWLHDLSDEDVLEYLVALNLERAGKQ